MTHEASEQNAESTMTMTFEVVVIPVADVERAMSFYSRLGWRLDSISIRATAIELFSSHHLVQDAPSRLAAGSVRELLDPLKACTWWWPISMPLAPTC